MKFKILLEYTPEYEIFLKLMKADLNRYPYCQFILRFEKDKNEIMFI
jgi:hypothetical protein